MKASSLLLVAAVCSITTILSGCGSNRTARLDQSAEIKGRAEADVILPDWPLDCRKTEPHAALIDGAEIRAILLRERASLGRQNARSQRCTQFYDMLKKGFEQS